MHLRSRYLPRPSANSPPDNRAHPMANPGQIPDLEGLHREIHGMAEHMRIMNENNGRLMQLLAAANPPLSAAPPVPDIERSRHSNRSGDRSQNISTERVRGRRRAPSPSLRERSSSSESSKTPARARRGRSLHRGDHIEARNKQTEPPFIERVLRARISSKFKLPAQLGVYEGKTNPMDHLDSYKSLMSVQGCSDKVMCKEFSATLKGPARSNRQKNASHLFTVHQKEIESLKDFVKRFNQAILEVEDPSNKSKVDKYIAAEELAEAKRRRRGKDDHKRKEPDTRRVDYREETRNKRLDRDSKRSNDRRPRTPPRRPEFILPPLNAPVAQNVGDDIEVLRDEVEQLTLADPRETNNTKPFEEVVLISIYLEYPDRHIMIDTELTDELRFALINFLKKNFDIFAWSQGDVPGIDPEIAMHKLFTNPKHSPVRQKRRKFAPERLKVIEDEVHKLIRANVVREAHYPDWLANVVVAPKKEGKWRVCVGFTDLNKTCPKDSFPLPKIDLIVDATSKHELLSFMDAFSGYHWIKMYPHDIEKTSFITERGLYCYKVMSFGLKNAGAMYQKLVNKMFKEQIGKTMEVYIDDMLVKSLRSSDHIAYLKARGIEVNPDQIQALISMSSPRNIREVQQLTGRVASLNRFVSKSADKCLTFFKILRKSQIFQWNEESENAFQQLKEYLRSPPLLTVPTTGEDLYVYLSISPTTVSAVLIREEDQVQKLIYYVSKVLMGAEARPRMAIKAQALADFIVESTHKGTPQPEIAPPEMEISDEPTPEKDLAHWILFVDGSSNQHGCGAGLVIQTPSGEQMEYAIRIEFKATSNEAEYEALLASLRVVVELGAQSLEIFNDSQLVVNQVQGDYLAKDARMMAYLDEVKAASAKIKECIPLEFLASSSIGVASQILQTEESPTWMHEIIAYLQGETLPKDKLQARRLQYKFARFCIFKGRLYKRSFSRPLLKCLRPEEAEYVLKEIHKGICGNHSGAKSLARKTIRQGYFWPTIERDAATYIRRCDKCQRFAPVSRLPHTEMVPMSSPWPFVQWGIDILGLLPRAPLQRKFLIVTIDYFTKWIEAQPLAKIIEKNTRDFVWKHLVCRFRIPKVIISDNARQFDNDKFKLFCLDLAISHHFSSPGHPQANGQVKITNRTILRNLKARLERSKSEWAEGLPSILWAYHTTSRIPTGKTPYSMVFGTESVILVEIGMPSFRTSKFDNESNEAELRLNLDLLEERREKAELRQAAYKCQVAKYYNQRVKHRSFLPGNLVLRRVTLSTKEPNAGKLSPTWEGILITVIDVANIKIADSLQNDKRSDLSEGYLSPNPLDRGKTSPTFSMEPRQDISIELAQSQSAVSSSLLGEVEYLA
ncbi:hypothetical protein Acr_00g0055000 [Actinidia rufa]|uniref:Integrase catalytic domain-containing protein n=1 Tax=Actinidia rufa TaxID=165716 RepID=A0A7J0DLY3_9ERIC|nr:hypothetical protein Acr_00g0055000 [Actinidia rufa]